MCDLNTPRRPAGHYLYRLVQPCKVTLAALYKSDATLVLLFHLSRHTSVLPRIDPFRNRWSIEVARGKRGE